MAESRKLTVIESYSTGTVQDPCIVATPMDIHDACENGNEHLVIQLLTSKQASLTDRDDIGNTPLHNACLGAQVKLVKLFLGEAIDYQHLAADNNSVAVQIGNERFLEQTAVHGYRLPRELCIDREQLRLGGAIYRDNYGSTPLTTLCALGSDTDTDAIIARLLILAGDPVNAAKSTDHMSPLSWAAYHGDLDLLSVLLDPCTGPRANPVWESLPNQSFPIDLAGLRAASNGYEDVDGNDANDAVLLDAQPKSRAPGGSPRIVQHNKRGGKPIRSSSLPKECCMYLVEYGVACLGEELKFAQTSGNQILPSCLCRYRTHLLYWAATFGMVTQVRQILKHREEALESKHNGGSSTEHQVVFQSGALGMKLNVHPEAMGCFVHHVELNSQSYHGQVQVNDQIMKVGTINVLNAKEAMKELQQQPRPVVLTFRRTMDPLTQMNRAEFDIMLPSNDLKLLRNGKEHVGSDYAEKGSSDSSNNTAYNGILLGGAMFYPIDGKDSDYERSDGEGGAVLYSIAKRTAAAYDGRMVRGQSIVQINGKDVSSCSFTDIGNQLLKIHNDSNSGNVLNEGSGGSGGSGGSNGQNQVQIPDGRVILTLRDPDVYSIQHAHQLDMTSGEIEALHPLALCAPDIAYETPLHAACKHGHDGIVKLMLTTMNKKHTHFLKKNNSPNSFSSLATTSVLSDHPNWFSSTRDTPLHVAAASDYLRVVKLLLNHKPPIDVGHRNTAGWSEHGIAMAKCKFDCVFCHLLLS